MQLLLIRPTSTLCTIVSSATSSLLGSPLSQSQLSVVLPGDSSAEGEVQDKDPRTFARHLGFVFSEGRRVLKDDGVLAFSFHHSRPEGWAAIYCALADAGMSVVAAHPVHAELRAASPKSAAKDPISLDAILVCRKRTAINAIPYSLDKIMKRTAAFSIKLAAGGLHLSRADHFVIAAGQTLIAAGHESLTFEEIEQRLEEIRDGAVSCAPESLVAAE